MKPNESHPSLADAIFMMNRTPRPARKVCSQMVFQDINGSDEYSSSLLPLHGHLELQSAMWCPHCETTSSKAGQQSAASKSTCSSLVQSSLTSKLSGVAALRLARKSSESDPIFCLHRQLRQSSVLPRRGLCCVCACCASCACRVTECLRVFGELFDQIKRGNNLHTRIFAFCKKHTRSGHYPSRLLFFMEGRSSPR